MPPAIELRQALEFLRSVRACVLQTATRLGLGPERPAGFRWNGPPAPAYAPSRAHGRRASPGRWSPGSRGPTISASRAEWLLTRARRESRQDEIPGPNCLPLPESPSLRTSVGSVELSSPGTAVAWE